MAQSKARRLRMLLRKEILRETRNPVKSSVAIVQDKASYDTNGNAVKDPGPARLGNGRYARPMLVAVIKGCRLYHVEKLSDTIKHDRISGRNLPAVSKTEATMFLRRKNFQRSQIKTEVGA